MNVHNTRKAADLLAEAETSGRMEDLPSDLAPGTPEEAYAIQEAGLSGPSGIIGWKVAPAAPGAVPRCAPMAQKRLLPDGGRMTGLLFAPEAEAEFALLLGRDLPPREAAYGTDEVVAAIASAHVAIEILDSRFNDRKAVSPLAALADGQSNRFVVYGGGVSDWQGLNRSRPAPMMEIDGETYRVTKDLPDAEQIIDVCVWLANHASAKGLGLRKGQIIITGARVGPLPVPPGSTVRAELEGVGTVSLTRPASKK